MFEDKRKYFDYELAYKGFKKAKKLFDKGGIQAILNSDEFEISGGGTIEDWSCNGYIDIYGSGYNFCIVLVDKNFDTDNLENKWYISGEVDIYSYGGGDDNLYITDISSIEERIGGLLDYAKDNDYTIEDYEKELESLEKVYAILGKKSIKFNLDENNNIQSVEIEDINNKVEHYFNEEDDEEKEEYYNSKLRNIIKDYVDYLEENREEV
jgi:hypothetical protein